MSMPYVRSWVQRTTFRSTRRSRQPWEFPSPAICARLRHQQKMTLSAAAAGAGLSVGFLSSLERGKVNASVAALQRLAVFYKTNVQSFFGSTKKPRKFLKARDRKQLSNEPGVNIELLALGDHVMEPHLYTLAPGTSSGGAYHHEGEEFIYLVSGCCEIWLDEVEYYPSGKRRQPLFFQYADAPLEESRIGNGPYYSGVNTPPTF
jgi:transcriptional regulator with XRE-family HTH domain